MNHPGPMEPAATTLPPSEEMNGVKKRTARLSVISNSGLVLLKI